MINNQYVDCMKSHTFFNVYAFETFELIDFFLPLQCDSEGDDDKASDIFYLLNF